MKHFFCKMLSKVGIYARPIEDIRFGTEWSQDIKYLIKGRNLELVIDVGANIGQTAYRILKLAPQSSIYCFEPIPSTFNKLVENTKRFSRVFPVNSALGEQLETLTVASRPLSEQNSLIYNSNDTALEDSELVNIRVETLDQFCANKKIAKINLLKVDTEGYEMKVLRGAKRLISSGCIDYILIECEFLKRESEPHGDFVEILNYLQPFKYNVVAFYTGGIDNFGWKWGDVLFSRETCDKDNLLALSPLLIIDN